MADSWFFAFDQVRFGPFSGRELHNLAELGRIQPTDTVWKGGVAQGIPASRVKYLFSPFPATAAVAVLDVRSTGDLHREERPPPAPSGTGPPLEDTAGAPAAPALEKPPAGVAPAVAPVPAKAKTGRAVVVKGAVIVSQNGVTVKFLKKCTTCGHQDSSWNTVPIKNGSIRAAYFCPKCKKSRDVEVRGSVY